MAYHISGPCKITYNSRVLGKTKADIIIRPKVTWNPVIVNEHGAAPAGYIYAGQSAVAEAVLAEFDESGSQGFHRLQQGMFPGGLLGYLGGGSGDPCLIGETALTAQGYGGSVGNGICKVLQIEELVSGDLWIADKAFVLDPAEFVLAATSEQNVPIVFVIIPVNDQLFSTTPYLVP